MKKENVCRRSAMFNILPPLIMLGACFLLSFLQTAHGQARSCQIKTMVGDVKVQRNKSAKWVNAQVKMTLKEHDVVRTFVESEAVLETGEGSTMTIGENTTLELATLLQTGGSASKTNVKIMSGTLMANVKKLVNSQSKFEFETPTAVAAIRGTQVGFSVQQSKTEIKVYEGVVLVIPKGSKSGSELQANQMAVIEKGQKTVEIKTFSAEEKDMPGQPVTDTAGTGAENDTLQQNLNDTLNRQDSLNTPAPGLNQNTPQDTGTGAAATLGSVNTNQGTPSGRDSAGSGNTALTLMVNTPQSGQVFEPGSQIMVTGNVSPPGTSVKIRGVPVVVMQNGDFKFTDKAPLEEGEYSLDIDANYRSSSRSVTRTCSVKSGQAPLSLTVAEPQNNAVTNKPSVRVSGTVTPGAEVAVSGIPIPVTASGAFVKDIPIPDEEGSTSIEIIAQLRQKTVSVQRTIHYQIPQEEITITILAPADRQVLCNNRVLVKGSVKPNTIEKVTVNGTDISVRSGFFNEFITLPQVTGNHAMEFEVSGRSKSKTASVTVVYDPASRPCNVDNPVIQPGYLPASTKLSQLFFTVYDKTPFDEITWHTSMDGMKSYETGLPGSRFSVAVEKGLHAYELYAVDRAGNMSQKIVGTVGYLAQDLSIKTITPSSAYSVVYIPPPAPNSTVSPEYTITFSVNNLPDDNPLLLKEVRVVNKQTASAKSQKKFSNSIEFSFDMSLTRGRNVFSIEVRDMNDKLYVKECVIDMK